jgi:hypothetical protein
VALDGFAAVHNVGVQAWCPVVTAAEYHLPRSHLANNGVVKTATGGTQRCTCCSGWWLRLMLQETPELLPCCFCCCTDRRVVCGHQPDAGAAWRSPPGAELCSDGLQVCGSSDLCPTTYGTPYSASALTLRSGTVQEATWTCCSAGHKDVRQLGYHLCCSPASAPAGTCPHCLMPPLDQCLIRALWTQCCAVLVA